tara:strand:- start:1120 stop:1314 length:195 start_codon:yes stop_codon:yes gene_type:complete
MSDITLIKQLAQAVAELDKILEEEVFQKTFCTTCDKDTVSSKADYQSEFTCNTCGSEVKEVNDA